jgi:hypothetical protein
LARFECTRNFETIFQADFPSFLHCRVQDWQIHCEKEGIKRDFPPLFWGWFTLPSAEVLQRLHILSFLQDPPVLKQVIELTARSAHDEKITKCQVLWRGEYFPLVGIPSVVSLAILPE